MRTIKEIMNLIDEIRILQKNSTPFDSSRYNNLLYNRTYSDYNDLMNHLQTYVENCNGGFGDDF